MVIQTLTTSDGALSNGHYKVLILSGSPSGAFDLLFDPNDQQNGFLLKHYYQAFLLIKQGGGSGSTVAVPNGTSTIVFADGTGANANVNSIPTDLLSDTTPQLEVT